MVCLLSLLGMWLITPAATVEEGSNSSHEDDMVSKSVCSSYEIIPVANKIKNMSFIDIWSPHLPLDTKYCSPGVFVFYWVLLSVRFFFARPKITISFFYSQRLVLVICTAKGQYYLFVRSNISISFMYSQKLVLAFCTAKD